MKHNISHTAYRVLLVLKYLNKEAQTLEAILEKLNSERYVDSIITREILKKYLNTITETGFNLVKTHKNNETYYEIRKSLFPVAITDDELNTIAYVHNVLDNLALPVYLENYEKTLGKILKYLPDSQSDVVLQNIHQNALKDDLNFKKYVPLIQTIENYCKDKLALEIDIDAGDHLHRIIVCSPLKLVFYYNNLYLSVIDHGTNVAELIPIKQIHHVKQLPNTAKYSRLSNTVFFKVFGKVARGYRPYLGETILEKDVDSLLISTNITDQELFFRKILRYGKFCKIISPESVKKSFIAYLEQAATLYA